MSSNAPQSVLPLNFFTALPESSDGLHVVGTLDAPTVRIERAVLLVDMQAGAIKLMAPCGCYVQISLAAMVLGLADTAARAPHPDAANPPSHPTFTDNFLNQGTHP
ncbi:MAG: hypothetical protein Q8R98_20865 [Rubrivivax sp.]|nr:hypothetical protein [Rubrivivax sp.]MDP3223690.1 hypothetical protein [Rubrivivax sp.]MDP3614301.1 hypothetical protein [Rubrivivax sp.]